MSTTISKPILEPPWTTEYVKRINDFKPRLIFGSVILYKLFCYTIEM